MGELRVLLSEGSSLTAREHVTVLGSAGVQVEVMSSTRWALCRWSRWVHRVHACPAAATDPLGYLAAVGRVLAARRFDALLATHEQAWLFAVARDRLPPQAPLAVAPAQAFAQVQSKLAFARLLDTLGVRQPRWWPVDGAAALDRIPYPYYLKTPFSTAGRGVRPVRSPAERATALAALLPTGDRQAIGSPARTSGDGEADAGVHGLAPDDAPLMAQAVAPGEYGQVQALFEHGRPVALHTSTVAGAGVGGSAAARVSVDHPAAREAAVVVGRALGWHGGLTLDYLHTAGRPSVIECNPRTVEPANAASGGVDLPRLSVGLATGWRVPGATGTSPGLAPPVAIGRPGRRTHGTLALLLGTAERAGSRRAVLSCLADATLRRGAFDGSTEVLTPLLHDPVSLVPLATVVASLLLRPSSVQRLTTGSVEAYSVGPEAIAAATVAEARGGHPEHDPPRAPHQKRPL